MANFWNFSILELALAILSLFPFLIILATVILNATTGPFLRKKFPLKTCPKISLLIPARNEEKNIANVLESLLGQDYPNFEIIMLDDNSTDKTREIAEEIAADNPKLKIIPGRPLPSGWLGKNYACSLLAGEAKGEILIFTDADNTHDKSAISNTVARMQHNNLDFLSAFPQQLTITYAEKLIVPLIDLIVYSALILWTTYYFKSPLYSAANGQWVAFTRNGYRKSGGHEAVKSEIVEDVALARKAKKKGLRSMTLAGTGMVFGRMYDSFSSAWHGMTKIMYGIVFNNFPALVIICSMLLIITIAPYFFLLSGKLLFVGIAGIAAGLLWRAVLSLRFKSPVILNILLHPATIIFLVALAFNSWWQANYGSFRWKGREIKIEKK